MNADRNELVHDLLTRAASQTPDRTAVISTDGTETTFAGLDQQARSIAAWITERANPGDRLAVVADNSLAYVLAYYAASRSGCVLALINQRLSPNEQATLIQAADPTILLGDTAHLDNLGLAAAGPSTLEHVVSFGTPAWREATHHEPAALPVIRPDDPAWLLFTSGSTGTPKGALHTHRSMTAGVRGTVEGRAIAPGSVYLLPFPMCHIAGYNVLVHHATASTVVLASQFRPAEFVQTVNRYAVTSCSLAPTMLHALLAYVDASGLTMPSLRSIAYGSSAITPDLISRAGERLGVDFSQGYGMTESAGNVTFLGPPDHRAGAAGEPAILQTVGRPHPFVEVRLIDDDGGGVPSGQAGEIAVRGEQVMTGYWRDDVATADAFVDGWFRTGDIGRLDAGGRLAIVDRRKDVIVSGGENVSSREVEDALSNHPGVDMAAVVAVPDDYWGEAVCAVVVPRGDLPPSADDLIAHVRTQIAPFKRPRHVLFVDELPMTTNGKVAKDQVRTFAGDQTAGASPAY